MDIFLRIMNGCHSGSDNAGEIAEFCRNDFGARFQEWSEIRPFLADATSNNKQIRAIKVDPIQLNIR